MVIGYTTGVFDLFHIGHLNIIRTARGLCDRLIVGVSTDELVKEKGKTALTSFVERIEIVRALRFVDAAVPQTTTDKVEEFRKLRFNVIFVGDDWHGDKMWREFETKGLHIVYLPYTKGISSTIKRARLK